MNFIGHLLIAEASRTSKLGNILPDLLPMRTWKTFPSEIIEGCYLHQAVDRRTDSHPDFIKIKRTMPNNWRHWGGILLDLAIDYTLSNNFHEVSEESFQLFAKKCYATLLDELALVDNTTLRIRIQRMVEHDWLYAYHDLAGLKRVLAQLDSRTRFETPFEKGTTLLMQHQDEWRDQLLTVWHEVAAESCYNQSTY